MTTSHESQPPPVGLARPGEDRPSGRDEPAPVPVTAMPPPGWEGILDPGETILWQGRPDGAVTLTPGSVVMALFGLLFAGFALFWMVMASLAGGYFWMFGLIHFAVGVGIMVSGPLGSAFTRRHSYYTLTDRRAFIATDLPLVGRRLRSYPITADTTLDFEDGALATLNFATVPRRGRNGVHEVPVGFARIRDGRAVLALMRDIQTRLAKERA